MRLLLAIIFSVTLLCAEASPRHEATNTVAELLRQLGADSCTTRDRAEEQLRTFGPDVISILKTYKDSRDPEIRMRVGRLLQGVVPSIRQFLELKGKCTGFADEGSSHWPCVLEVKTFDATSGVFTGTIEWTSLDAKHAIEGKLEANKLVFSETKIIRRGNALLNCVYTLNSTPANPDNPGRLTGTWKNPQDGRGGNVELHLNSSPTAE